MAHEQPEEAADPDVDPELTEAIRQGIEAIDKGDSISFDDYVALVNEKRRLRDQTTCAGSSILEPEAVSGILEALAQPEADDLPHEDFLAKRAEWRRNRDASTERRQS